MTAAVLRTALAPAEEAIGAIARGEMVVVVDSPDWENEGGLVLAAESVPYLATSKPNRTRTPVSDH